MQLHFKDEEQDAILIDGPASWERAVARFLALEQRNQGFGRLLVSDKSPASGAASAPIPIASTSAAAAAAVVPGSPPVIHSSAGVVSLKPLSATSISELQQFALSTVHIEETKRVERQALYTVLSQASSCMYHSIFLSLSFFRFDCLFFFPLGFRFLSIIIFLSLVYAIALYFLSIVSVH